METLSDQQKKIGYDQSKTHKGSKKHLIKAKRMVYNLFVGRKFFSTTV